MVGALEALGVGVEADWAAGRAVVHGCGGRFPAQGAELFLGNAGTAMRCKQPLLTPLRGVDPLNGSTVTSCAFEAAGPSCEAYRNASSCPPALHLAGLRHQAPDSPGIDVCTVELNADSNLQLRGRPLCAAVAAAGRGHFVLVELP